eukprot:CAMPEP_0172730454 /NCGR_PEP_ID=MMETSP1074-20121228/98178_1 /TAXON_ID=2916 /ORGANISM="Ceratium fusus, Strain PA161109" /LENGTH=245 /DNA_ID=CAMNT_0013558189 /DNA_START=64 /DNA_END=801 /DNA_ORIENTATION=+
MSDLRAHVAQKTGISADRQLLKVGVPPKLLREASADQCLTDLGCQSRDTLIVEEVTEVLLPVSSTPKSAGRVPSAKLQNENVGDAPASDLLPAFDRAIAAAREHVKLLPEDKHQVWALQRGKAVVQESLKRGDNISLSALHTLKGVGHWVVQELKRHLDTSLEAESAASASKRPRVTGSRQSIAPPTPASFSWWYLGRDGKRAGDRNSAEVSGPLGAEQYRVCILHSSGRMERAWLPEAKAPPRC